MTKMGRKPKDNIVRETKITIKVSEEEARRIEEIAEYLELPKTVLLRNLALFGLDSAEDFRKVGILKAAKGYVKTSEWLKKMWHAKEQQQEAIR